MEKTTFRPSAYGRADYFANGGFTEIDLHLTKSPIMYAERLARYISDPSTIRARVLEQFGYSPSLEKIRRIREDHAASLKAARDRFNIPDWPDEKRKPVIVFTPPQQKQEPIPEPEKPAADWRGLPLNNARDVVRACATAMAVTIEDVIGPSREARITRARHFAAAILKARGSSYPQVARHLGRNDHSSAINSIRKFFNIMMRDPEIIEMYQAIAPERFKDARTLEEFNALVRV